MSPAKYLVDTGILIYALRSDLRAFRLLNRLTATAPIATSAVCAFEILRGTRSDRQEAATENMISRLEVISLDILAGRHAARIMRTHPGIFGSKETVPDALIAGCAVEGGATLVTLNRRQFERLVYPDLDVLIIEQDAPDWIVSLS
jgi:predicted nucleic acid-binding protein